MSGARARMWSSSGVRPPRTAGRCRTTGIVASSTGRSARSCSRSGAASRRAASVSGRSAAIAGRSACAVGASSATTGRLAATSARSSGVVADRRVERRAGGRQARPERVGRPAELDLAGGGRVQRGRQALGGGAEVVAARGQGADDHPPLGDELAQRRAVGGHLGEQVGALAERVRAVAERAGEVRAAPVGRRVELREQLADPLARRRVEGRGRRGRCRPAGRSSSGRASPRRRARDPRPGSGRRSG